MAALQLHGFNHCVLFQRQEETADKKNNSWESHTASEQLEQKWKLSAD